MKVEGVPMNRTAPLGGYNFQNKADYREQIWKRFSTEVKDVSKAKILFLPSKEGLEIPVALGYGFKEENLIAVDMSSIVGISEWIKQYPKITFYGSELKWAVQRIIANGITLDAANLDLCGNLSIPMLNTVTTFIQSGVLSTTSMIAVTMMKGREGKEIAGLLAIIQSLLSECKYSDRLSLLIQLSTKDSHIFSECTTDEYKSVHTTRMIWGVYKLVEKSYITHALQVETDKRTKAIHSLITEKDRLIKVHEKITRRLHSSHSYFNEATPKYTGFSAVHMFIAEKRISHKRVCYINMYEVYENTVKGSVIKLNKKQVKRIRNYIIYLQVKIDFIQRKILSKGEPIHIQGEKYPINIIRHPVNWYPQEMNRCGRGTHLWNIKHIEHNKSVRKAVMKQCKNINKYIKYIPKKKHKENKTVWYEDPYIKWKI